ncbi:hypothetical protein HPB47_000153 [Ixodes persulcatus]|uniref:Uncharacterized protein n=1 Tax=Ixodes persulcatus TaxID=34615 RepID=A0AC60PSZ8_IXOPE|nr:hypothetical protein HPB47_000153 [Ixodes persulcatus]
MKQSAVATAIPKRGGARLSRSHAKLLNLGQCSSRYKSVRRMSASPGRVGFHPEGPVDGVVVAATRSTWETARVFGETPDGEAEEEKSLSEMMKVATSDASEAEHHELFARPLKSVSRSCRSLWNKQGQSPVAAETIVKYCGRVLLRPVSTRWNSFFDALECILSLDAAGKDLDGLCRTLQVPPF